MKQRYAKMKFFLVNEICLNLHVREDLYLELEKKIAEHGVHSITFKVDKLTINMSHVTHFENEGIFEK